MMALSLSWHERHAGFGYSRSVQATGVRASTADETRPATVREVARVAQVSTGTISNYLNKQKRVSDKTSKRIEAAIAELHFVPNSAVRVVLGARSHAIAFVVPDSANPFLVDIQRGIEDVAFEHGHIVVSCSTDRDHGREAKYVKALSEMRIFGVIAVASDTSDKTLETIKASGAAVVSLGESRRGHDSVLVDNEEGGYLAARHLVQLGHRRIVFFGGPNAVPQIADRLQGMKRALLKAGLPLSSIRRYDADGSSMTSRIVAANLVLDSEAVPLAVFCANDQLALALESAAIRRGLDIPADVAIVGYDDTEGAATAAIALTTIRQPGYLLGSTAADLLFQSADRQPGQARRISFAPELIRRDSTTP